MGPRWCRPGRLQWLVVDHRPDTESQLFLCGRAHDHLFRRLGIEHPTIDDDGPVHLAKPLAIDGHEEDCLPLHAGYPAEAQLPPGHLADLGTTAQRSPVGIEYVNLAREGDGIGGVGPLAEALEGRISVTGTRYGCESESCDDADKETEGEERTPAGPDISAGPGDGTPSLRPGAMACHHRMAAPTW